MQRRIYDTFVARLVQATKTLKVGDPFDPDTQVAPLIHQDHRASVAQMVAQAVADGAQVLCGGAAPTGGIYDKGAYYLPTILAGVENTAAICRDEVFGPVLVVLPFDDDSDVIAQGNDNAYGLACGIWTSDFPKAWRVARAIQAGTVWVNTYKQFSAATPFGGEKDAGLGREKGREGIRAYMAQKSVYVDLSGRPHPWARWPQGGA